MAKAKGNPWKGVVLGIGAVALAGGAFVGGIATGKHLEAKASEEQKAEDIQTPETDNEVEATAYATYAEAVNEAVNG